MRFSKLAPGWLFAGLVLILFSHCSGLQPDELDCEEAVSYLEKCCPTFHPTGIACVQGQGCDTEQPDISQAQSTCIRGKSCEQLQTDGTCAAASQPSFENGTPYGTTTNSANSSTTVWYGDGGAYSTAEICQ